MMPMCAGVLGTDIEEHKIGVVAMALQSPFFGAELQRVLFCVHFFVEEFEGPHFGGAGGMFLAERVALPGAGHENTLQMGMTVEPDAEHVVHFPFIPVGGGP